MGEDVEVKLTGQEIQIGTGTFSWKKAREYWHSQPLMTVIYVLLVLGSPFVGLFFAGWPGVVVGLITGVVGSIVGLYAITRVREITSSE